MKVYQDSLDITLTSSLWKRNWLVQEKDGKFLYLQLALVPSFKFWKKDSTLNMIFVGYDYHHHIFLNWLAKNLKNCSKNSVFQNQDLKILSISLMELEIVGMPFEIPNTLKTTQKSSRFLEDIMNTLYHQLFLYSYTNID